MQDITSLTYTVTYAGDTEPTVEVPQVKTANRNGMTLTTIRHLAPLLADHIDAIANEADRLHTLTVLRNATIAIWDTPAEDAYPDGPTNYGHARDHETLRTTYAGTRDLPADVVLDLAEQLRTRLGL